MKFLALLAFITLASGSASVEYYDSEIDKLDIDSIVRCPARMRNFTGCFIDRNECDDMATIIKKIFGDAIETQCQRCSTKQRQYAKKYFVTLKSCYPEDYELVKKKYDPTGKKLEETIKALECD